MTLCLVGPVGLESLEQIAEKLCEEFMSEASHGLDFPISYSETKGYLCKHCYLAKKIKWQPIL